MRESAASGTIIVAIGGSAASFGTWARDMRGGTGAVEGLGWINRTVIDTGFDPANDASLRRLMSLPDVDLGLGIPAKTALIIDGSGATTIVGEGQVAAFRKR